LINMSDAEFDDVNRVHMRGHFCATRAIARYWRDAGTEAGVARTVVNTSSGAGLYGNPGQTNYSGAKAAIAAYTQVWAKELGRYGVKVNAISPLARTRLTERSPQVGELMRAPSEGFDFYHPGNASPLVVYLSSSDCQFNGHLFYMQGDQVSLMRGWGVNVAVVDGGERWSASNLRDQLQPLSGEAPVGDWDTISSYRENL
jgi:NAD(P)-dependent dehydrogenase (short-subunit alcohol dehydrogenase family)